MWMNTIFKLRSVSALFVCFSGITIAPFVDVHMPALSRVPDRYQKVALAFLTLFSF
jgi:hypothetical protein